MLIALRIMLSVSVIERYIKEIMLHHYEFNYNLIDMDHHPQNANPSSGINHYKNNQTLYLEQQELSSYLFNYYVQLRSDNLPALTTALPQQFAKIQKEIIGVVQLRKDMQKSIEIDAIQSQHFDTIVHLVEQKLKIENQVNILAQQIKQSENSHIRNLMSLQRSRNTTNNINQNQILTKSHHLLTQIMDLKRTVNILTPNQHHIADFSIQSTAKDQEQYIEQIFKEQSQKWNHTKLIYAIKFNELSLRQELIEQREAAFRDYERSNSELIEVLLREKQRDKNLRKKDKQKFEQMLKMSHEIDIQNEELSHSQRTLNSHYEVELLRIKDKLNQGEQRHRGQVYKLNQVIEMLRKQLAQGREKQQQQQSIQKKDLILAEELSEIKKLNSLLHKQKQQVHSQLAAQIGINTQLTIQYQTLNKQNIQLKLTTDKLTSKNEQLLTQFNETVLKNSQNSHIKAQLNQKLENSAKTIQQLQLNNQKYTRQISSVNQEHQRSLSLISKLQSQIKQLQNKISHQTATLLKRDQYIKQCQSRLAYLQSQLTDISISHNHQTKILQQQLTNKSQLISLLNKQVIQQQQQIQQQTKLISNPSIQQTALLALKTQVMAELQRSDHIKNNIIDEMVQRVARIIR